MDFCLFNGHINWIKLIIRIVSVATISVTKLENLLSTGYAPVSTNILVLTFFSKGHVIKT